MWLPYYIKRLFYNGFRAKVKWLYEGRRFSTPPEPLLDGLNIGNSVLLWYWVKSIYDRGKNFFSIFFAFWVQKIHQQISLSLMFSMFLVLYYEKNKTYFYTSDYIKECNVCQQIFCNTYLVIIFKLLFGGSIPPSSTVIKGYPNGETFYLLYKKNILG